MLVVATKDLRLMKREIRLRELSHNYSRLFHSFSNKLFSPLGSFIANCPLQGWPPYISAFPPQCVDGNVGDCWASRFACREYPISLVSLRFSVMLFHLVEEVVIDTTDYASLGFHLFSWQ